MPGLMLIPWLTLRSRCNVPESVNGVASTLSMVLVPPLTPGLSNNNAGDGSFFAATAGSALTGGSLAGTDLDTIYAQFGASGTFTIQCALSTPWN